MSDNYIKVTVTGNKSKNVSVKSTELKNQITAGADMSIYYSNKAKEWAISDKLVDNEDYSSKYHANLAKSYTEEGALQIAEITTLREQTLADIETEKQNVIDIGTDQINQVTTISNTAISDIETNKTNALSDIDSAKTIVLEDISTQETQTINNIKETADVELDKIVGAGIDSRANIDLSNLSEAGEKHFLGKSQITNCITEIPQRLKWDYSNGVITLYAGSELTIPDGWEDTGKTIRKFKHVKTEVDIVWNNTTAIVDRYLFAINNFTSGANYDISWASTGDTAPTLTANWGIWYDTANNLVKMTSNKGSTWTSGIPFPCFIAKGNGTNYEEPTQVFNGYGHIGTGRWVDKGIKALFSIGKNPDGTYINEEFETTDVRIEKGAPGANRQYEIQLSSALDNQIYYAVSGEYHEQTEEPTKVAYHRWFNPDTGLSKRCLTIDGVLQWLDYPSAPLLTMVHNGTTYTKFSGRSAFRAADWNDLRTYAVTPATTVSSASNARPAVVVKNYRSGTEWYRVWSDGWKEQGGYIAANVTKIVTFLQAFSDNNYGIWRCNNNNHTGVDVPRNEYSVYEKSATKVTIKTTSYSGATYWMACGY